VEREGRTGLLHNRNVDRGAENRRGIRARVPLTRPRAEIDLHLDGEIATGTVTEISPVPDTADAGGVVSYPIVVALDAAPDGTASGMTAEVQVIVAQAIDVLAVPATAVNGSDGNYSVMVLGADGQATSAAVEVGLITSDLAEISSGLTEGDTVITGISTAQTGTTDVTTGGPGAFPGGDAFPVGGVYVISAPASGRARKSHRVCERLRARSVCCLGLGR
jgi:multidrug efflux pump subunit AcrA (membrane-fusion protein)